MIIAIIRSSGSGVESIEEFRHGANFQDALEKFIADNPLLDMVNYGGVETTWADKDDKLNLPWAYDYANSLLVEDIDTFKDRTVFKLVGWREKKLAQNLLFEYPSLSGKFFSCSNESQNNWVNLAKLADIGGVVFPFTVTTFDSRDFHQVELADINPIILAMSIVVLEERQSCRLSIAAVLGATDIESVQSVADLYLST